MPRRRDVHGRGLLVADMSTLRERGREVVGRIGTKLNSKRCRQNVELHVDVDDVRMLVRLAQLGLKYQRLREEEATAMVFASRGSL